MSQCQSHHPIHGQRCELSSGHEGIHDSGEFRWTPSAKEQLPKRNAREMAESLRIRALVLTGEKWERDATRDMMKEAADLIEAAESALLRLREQMTGVALLRVKLEAALGEAAAYEENDGCQRIRRMLQDAIPLLPTDQAGVVPEVKP